MARTNKRPAQKPPAGLEELEIALLLEGIERRYGGFKPELRKNVVFGSHNFVTDASFNQFDVILSRAVLPYLGQSLQGRVHSLFYDSLPRAGFLALGRGIDLRLTPFEPRYETVDAVNGLYRKRQ